MKRRIALVAVAGVCLLPAVPGWAQGSGTPAQNAARLYETAMSQLRTRQHKQVAQLLEQFVRDYPSHEHVPVAYLQLAYCYEQQKDSRGVERVLDEAIKRFYGSAAWFRAYAYKLKKLRQAGKHEEYLNLLEQMIRRAQQAPMRLPAILARSAWEFHRYEYRMYNLEPERHPLVEIRPPVGWILDVVAAGDTSERAQSALRVLAGTLNAHRQQLPTDWQVGHVLLLKKAGKADEADKSLKSYAAEWGDDPRGMGLWMLYAQRAEAAKDVEAADAAWQHMLKTYDGCHSLAEPLYRRVVQLGSSGRYEQFVELARYYLKTYAPRNWPSHVFELWVRMARPIGPEAQDTSRITEALEALEAHAPAADPLRQRLVVTWKSELNQRLGKLDEAAKLAEQLVGEALWSAESFAHVRANAHRHEAFKPILQAAREKYSIPEADTASEAAGKLSELRQRLKEDQVRHAEELGEQMLAEHRGDAATVEAVRVLVDYYFRKVLRAPRDKWMVQMLEAYPYHPLTQGVLAQKIQAERAEKRFSALAKSLSAMAERFPGAYHGSWYPARLEAFDAAGDAEGKLKFVQRVLGTQAERGEFHAIDEIAKCELQQLKDEQTGYPDFKATGDYWMGKARKFPDTRTAVLCLDRAWTAYYRQPREGYWRNRGAEVHWNEAMEAAKALQAQQVDPEANWRMAYADVNLLAERGDGAGALSALDERLKKVVKARDLSIRLDMGAVGSASVTAGLGNKAMALANRLRRICFTDRDEDAIDLMLGRMYLTAKQDARSGRQYLNIVNRARWPALRYGYFRPAMEYLRRGQATNFPLVIQDYVRKIDSAQELIPGLLYELGMYHLGKRSPAVLQVRQTLASRYPASSALDRLDEQIRKVQQAGR